MRAAESKMNEAIVGDVKESLTNILNY